MVMSDEEEQVDGDEGLFLFVLLVWVSKGNIFFIYFFFKQKKGRGNHQKKEGEFAGLEIWS
jgi:hypothetical protein